MKGEDTITIGEEGALLLSGKDVVRLASSAKTNLTMLELAHVNNLTPFLISHILKECSGSLIYLTLQTRLTG